MFVSLLESTMLGDLLYHSEGSLMLAIGLIASLSAICSNQKNLIISYLLCITYSIIRTYFMIGILDIFRYVKFNICLILALLIVYTFSRIVNQVQRINFVQMKNQSVLLEVFGDMVSTFHDGIMITSNDRILLHNQQIKDIFDLKEGGEFANISDE